MTDGPVDRGEIPDTPLYVAFLEADGLGVSVVEDPLQQGKLRQGMG